MKTTTAITTVKREVRLQEWMEQIKAQQESGMTVTAYCAQMYIPHRLPQLHGLFAAPCRCLPTESFQ